MFAFMTVKLGYVKKHIIDLFQKQLIKDSGFLTVTFNAIIEFVQGDQDPRLKFQITITQKLSISDPTLVKPKCFWQWNIYLKNCKQTADKNVNKCSNSRIILALPMMGQKCLVSELKLFEISNLGFGHPVKLEHVCFSDVCQAW